MKEKDDYEYIEANEIIEDDLLQKLTDYNQILEKDQNLFIRIQNNRHHINLLSNLYYYRICTLGQIVPEENVIFTLYNLYSDESESEKESNKQGIDKLKERLSENENMKNKLRNNKSIKKMKDEAKKIISNTKSKEKEEKNEIVEKEEKDSVIILDEIKPSLLQKEDECFRNHFECFVSVWKNLYKWLLLFPLFILSGLLMYLYKDKYDFTFTEIICFIFIFVVSYTSMSGNEKMLSTTKVNFKVENALLGLTILFSIWMLICPNAKIEFEISAYKFLRQYFYFILILFSFLIIFCGFLIYLNIKMVNFYMRYSKNISNSMLIDKY
jgi:hypothetical protein